ncbi:hypothetical protein BDR03DRAFT_937713 [Suillus americanus]|nr:hypothetical protein BDR03DRAFT_937713 [Suillus americanus]
MRLRLSPFITLSLAAKIAQIDVSASGTLCANGSTQHQAYRAFYSEISFVHVAPQCLYRKDRERVSNHDNPINDHDSALVWPWTTSSVIIRNDFCFCKQIYR